MDTKNKKNEYNNTIKFQVITILKSSFCEMINNIWLKKFKWVGTYCTILYAINYIMLVIKYQARVCHSILSN